MPRALHSVLLTSLFAAVSAPAAADLVPGLLNDFQDGTLQGWENDSQNTANIADGGPLGTGDRYLQISVAPAGHVAAFTLDVAGVVEPSVVAVEADLMRPEGEGDLEVRFVLFGPSVFDRWTSLLAETVPADGVWRTYTFSILENDLAHVLGSATYADLRSGLDRIMFRNDAGAPSSTGTIGSGVLNVDNVFVVPEPAPSSLAAAATLSLLALARRRSRATRRA